MNRGRHKKNKKEDNIYVLLIAISMIYITLIDQ